MHNASGGMQSRFRSSIFLRAENRYISSIHKWFRNGHHGAAYGILFRPRMERWRQKNVKCKSLPNCRYATEFHFGHLCKNKTKKIKKTKIIIQKPLYSRTSHKYLVHLNGPFIYSEYGVNSGGVRAHHGNVSRSTPKWSTFSKQKSFHFWNWKNRLSPVQLHCTASRSSMSRTNKCTHRVGCGCVNAIGDGNHWTITFVETSIITWHWRRWVFNLVLQLVTGSSWLERLARH